METREQDQATKSVLPEKMLVHYSIYRATGGALVGCVMTLDKEELAQANWNTKTIDTIINKAFANFSGSGEAAITSVSLIYDHIEAHEKPENILDWEAKFKNRRFKFSN